MKQLIETIKKNMVDYQPIPFWSWNDKLETEELKRQIRWMHDNGIGGFFMHARGGLKTPYLSEEWMKCIDACCEEAEELGMKAWAYDENGWPSGFVGGKLLEDPNDRDMYILKKTGAYDVYADVSYLIEGERLVRVRDGKIKGIYLNLYLKHSASSVDILNPKVVDKFLANTHEEYKKYFGKDFSKKLSGFFTDEPQYYRWDTPYTPMVAAYFKEQYNEDILDKLGLLFVEKEGYRTFRYRYWCAMQELMLTNYAKKIYDWCENNEIKLTGHYVDEITMGTQVMCCGGVMPFYEYEHIPGIDWLGRDTDNELAPRQLGSAARQLGKEQILTETFGCCGWDVTPTELRRIAGFQYANGVNFMCHHLVPYSERGQRKRDYPAHFIPINPWVKEHFKEFNDYFTCLGFLLGTGEESVNVAMLHPIRSTYFDYKRAEEDNGFGVHELDEKLHEACRRLSSRGIAYHFLDETLLEKHGFVNGNTIGCGRCSYDYLVLPKMLTMGKATEEILCKFVNNGGKVLLLDDVPQYLEGELYEYTYLKSNCTLEEIVNTQPFQVESPNTELYYAYRIVEGKPFLFIQNVSKTESYTQTFQFTDGSQSFMVLNPVSLEIEEKALTIELHENESMLLFPIQKLMTENKQLKEVEFRLCDASVAFDTNFLTVNLVRYSKDGKHYSEQMYRPALFRQLLEERYCGKLWLKYDFEIQTLPEELVLVAEKANSFDCRINGQKFAFTDVYEDERSFYMADITPLVQVGKNSYETILDWYQSEETYYALFGENVTENLQNCIVYDSEIEAIYLSGKFGVYSHAGYEPYDVESVCSYGFYIGDIPNRVSEPTMDGFPFFRGKITAYQNLMLDTESTLLRIDGRYLTAKVRVNGNDAGELLFERRVDISPYAVKGINEIEVEYTIGNRNLMGPFHCECTEDFVGPIMFGMCDLPQSADGYLRYKLYRFYAEE